MNSRQLQYAVALSKIKNISQTAQNLGITQPALSKQILSLEKELGVTLFDRDTTPLSLTVAGESFIKEAKEILSREDSLKRSMEEFKNGEKGSLTIGISPFRATYFMSDIIMELQKEFSGLKIVLSEKNSTLLQQETIDGTVDFSILNLPVDEALLDVIPLDFESVVLVVPEKYKQKVQTAKGKSGEYPTVKFDSLSDIPFIALSSTQELRILFDKICEANGFVPNITTQVTGITTAYSLALAGVGATVLPAKFAQGNLRSIKDKNLGIYTIKNTSGLRQPAIVFKKGRYMSAYAKTAIEKIKTYQ
ncbi:MAG: LysR family transcriptional regulator [Ruminococcaceae bacterium]|nr:LysR family transcriptional regulator [Oscillospiraceae bacterium]